MDQATPLIRTLDQELGALARGASLECLVCGEFVLRWGGEVRCLECGSRLAAAAGENRGSISSTAS